MSTGTTRWLKAGVCSAFWLAVLLLHLPYARLVAEPLGGTVAAGSAQITSGPGGNVTVNQSSQRAVVNWQNFSIAPGETTTFVQPGSSAATLNRVTGGQMSRLNGTLNANGKVYLINPQGVVIGTTGRVNTGGGFTASTLDVADQEFLAGKGMTFSGSSSASVINKGKIRATDGDVMLIARHVDNQGKISAKKGEVHLAGGQEVLVQPSGTAGQRVFIRSGSGTVVNSGSIRATAAELRAAGGNEYALAVNNSGVIRATGVDRSGGRIVLKAEGTRGSAGTVRNSGRLVARSRTQAPGGTVVLTGDRVTLTSTSNIDAGSPLGKGGTVSVGGGFQGKDAAIANAQVVIAEPGSVISVDGGSKGGTAIIWSDLVTGFFGHISAKGPGEGSTTAALTPETNTSTGGFVEVSSHGLLDMRGTVETAGGTLLLDPASVTIDDFGGAEVDINFVIAGLTNTGTPAAAAPTSQVDYTLLQNRLATAGGSNVVIVTSSSDSNPGTIYVNHSVVWSSKYSLTLLSHRDIYVRASILNNYGGGGLLANEASINLVAGWDGNVSTGPFSAITAGPFSYGMNNGTVVIGEFSGSTPISLGSRQGDVNIAGYNIALNGGTAVAYRQVGYPGSTGSGTGNINILAVRSVGVYGGSGNGSYAQIGHGMLGLPSATRLPGDDYDYRIRRQPGLFESKPRLRIQQLRADRPWRSRRQRYIAGWQYQHIILQGDLCPWACGGCGKLRSDWSRRAAFTLQQPSIRLDHHSGVHCHPFWKFHDRRGNGRRRLCTGRARRI